MRLFFPESWGCFQKPRIYSAQSFGVFFLAATFVSLLTGKIVLRFVTTTTASELFPLNVCYASIRYNFHIFSNTKTNNLAEHFRKDKKARKDQSLCIISAINMLVRLPSSCLFSTVLCVSCATCCAGPC